MLRPPFERSIHRRADRVAPMPQPSGSGRASSDDAARTSDRGTANFEREPAGRCPTPDEGPALRAAARVLRRATGSRAPAAASAARPRTATCSSRRPASTRSASSRRDFFVVDRRGRVGRAAAGGPRPPAQSSAARSSRRGADARGAQRRCTRTRFIARPGGGPREGRRTDALEIRDLEMLKGIRGCTNRDVHRVPVIDNTPRERELVAQVEAALRDPRFASERTRSSSPTTAPTSGAPTSGRRSATPRSTTSCSRRSSHAIQPCNAQPSFTGGAHA